MIPTLTPGPLAALPALPAVLDIAGPHAAAGPQTANFTALLTAELNLAGSAALTTVCEGPVPPAAEPQTPALATGGNILPVLALPVAGAGVPAARRAALANAPQPALATALPDAAEQIVTTGAVPPEPPEIGPPAQPNALPMRPAQNHKSPHRADPAAGETKSTAEPQSERPLVAAAEAGLLAPPIELGAVPAAPAHRVITPQYGAQPNARPHSDAPLAVLGPVLQPATALPAAPGPSDQPARRAAAIDPPITKRPPAVGTGPLDLIQTAVPGAAVSAAPPVTFAAVAGRGNPLRAALQIRLEPAAASPVSGPASLSARRDQTPAPVLFEPVGPLVTPPLVTGAAVTAQPLPSTLVADRPLDFTAVLDRLVAARDAVQLQPAALIVAHSEFGAVRLQFRQDERGLAVSMTSTDPDFARSVAAAPPPVLPANPAPAAATNSAPGQRGDSWSDGQGAAGNQPRGPQPERRDAPPARTGQPIEHSPRGLHQSARHRGIFA